jgi:AraC-like DNA-binding protein
MKGAHFMRFDTYIPCDPLKPYVRNFAITQTIEERVYRVLPETGLVIGFQFKGRLSQIDGENTIPLGPSGITGIHDGYREFRNSEETGTLLVYFREAGASHFFKESLHELYGQSVSLDNFLLRSELIILEERLKEAKKDAIRIQIVEQFLISRLKERAPDHLVLEALAVLHQRRGNIQIKELAKQLRISQSPLEKRFRQRVGTSPKKFASIIRLKYAIQSYNPQFRLTALGYEAGFYDQSHFIKEFRHFTGEAPDHFFSKE